MMILELSNVSFHTKDVNLWQRLRIAFFIMLGGVRFPKARIQADDTDLVAVKPEFVTNYEKMRTDLSDARDSLREARELNDSAWCIITSASGGDWGRETSDWRDSATRWRRRWMGA